MFLSSVTDYLYDTMAWKQHGVYLKKKPIYKNAIYRKLVRFLSLSYLARRA